MLAFRRLTACVAFALMPHALAAQEPTVARQSPRAVDLSKADTTKEQKTHLDSSTRQRIANMKVWVDSAAGALPKQPNGADSLAKRSPAFVDTVVRRGETVVYRELIRAPRAQYEPRRYEPTMNGARAPETASSLPAIVLVGFGALVVGVVMLRRDDRSRDGA